MYCKGDLFNISKRAYLNFFYQQVKNLDVIVRSVTFGSHFPRPENPPIYKTGAPAGGKGMLPPPPPETEKIVERWFYFPELYKVTKILENQRENG